MLKHFMIGILLSTFLLVSVVRTYAGTLIRDLSVEIYTKSDEKIKDEPINIQILKDNTVLIYDSGWIMEERQLRKNSYNEWKAPGPGHPIRFPISLDDCSKLKLVVEKEGDKRWEVSFRVRANNDQVELMTDTPTVSFGNDNPIRLIRVENPLDGTYSTKAPHLNAGRSTFLSRLRDFHVFGFTCDP